MDQLLNLKEHTPVISERVGQYLSIVTDKIYPAGNSFIFVFIVHGITANHVARWAFGRVEFISLLGLVQLSKLGLVCIGIPSSRCKQVNRPSYSHFTLTIPVSLRIIFRAPIPRPLLYVSTNFALLSTMKFDWFTLNVIYLSLCTSAKSWSFPLP